MDLATYEREQSERGAAAETAAGRRAELVAAWIERSNDLPEVLLDIVGDPEYVNHIRRMRGAHGRGADAVILESAHRLIELVQEHADSYIGDRLVEREQERILEDTADEQLRRRGLL